MALRVLAAGRQGHRSPLFLGSYCEERLAVEGRAGSRVSQRRADEPKGVAGAGREDRSDFTVRNEPKNINSSAAAVMQLFSKRTLDPALIQ